MEPFSPIVIERPALRALDQTQLPAVEHWLDLHDLESICEAVASLRVRGAPLLGIVGAVGVAVAAESRGVALPPLDEIASQIGRVRPTAVELATGAASAVGAVRELPEGERLEALWRHAHQYLRRRIEEDEALGQFGASLLPPKAAVLTHCNTGALATGGIGTALGVVQVAWREGRLARCYATETRPLLQGARLTAWELVRAGIPATLLPDTAAASLIASGQVHAVITGADRIAMNGDAANKIGTYGLAVAAARHRVPFYIAAPRTTFDPTCPTGAGIPIEFRSPSEVGGFGGQRWSPEGIDAYNPAFDVTPAELVTAFITEAGVVSPPFPKAIEAILKAP